jgi:hypothetical protein
MQKNPKKDMPEHLIAPTMNDLNFAFRLDGLFGKLEKLAAQGFVVVAVVLNTEDDQSSKRAAKFPRRSREILLDWWLLWKHGS